MKALWDGLLKMADLNKDKVITIDEWVHVLEKTDKEHEPAWFNDYLTYMFKLFDVSGTRPLLLHSHR